MVSTRVARSSRPGSTSLWEWKLVEPTCERQRVGRVETGVSVVGFWLPGAGGFDSGRSFLAPRLNQLRRGDRAPAQPVSGRRLTCWLNQRGGVCAALALSGR